MPWLHTSHIYPISQDALQLLSEALTVLINYKAIVYGANNFWRRISSKLNTGPSLIFYTRKLRWDTPVKVYEGSRASTATVDRWFLVSLSFVSRIETGSDIDIVMQSSKAARSDSAEDHFSHFFSHPAPPPSPLHNSSVPPVKICICVICRCTVTVGEYEARMTRSHS